jgi:hypothetical protein
MLETHVPRTHARTNARAHTQNMTILYIFFFVGVKADEAAHFMDQHLS